MRAGGGCGQRGEEAGRDAEGCERALVRQGEEGGVSAVVTFNVRLVTGGTACSKKSVGARWPGTRGSRGLWEGALPGAVLQGQALGELLRRWTDYAVLW